MLEGYDQRLDILRHKYEQLDNVLEEAAARALNNYPYFKSVTIEYIPQVTIRQCDYMATLIIFYD